MAKHFTIFEQECNAKKAYYFDSPIENADSIGHLTRIFFPQSNKELIPDITVVNPVNPQKKEKIVAVLERIEWVGASTDPVIFSGRMSFTNKALMSEALACAPDTMLVEAAWIMYGFDYDQNKYFKQFYTPKPCTMHITENMRVNTSYVPNTWNNLPLAYNFNIVLTPSREHAGQEFSFAFSANGQQFVQNVGK